MRKLLLTLLVFAVASPALAVFPEQPIGSPVSYYSRAPSGRTALISPPVPSWPSSRPYSWANGDSDDLSFSQDNRNARLLVFDSSAGNLVPGDMNGARDVFVMRREAGGAKLGGTLSLASVATGGAAANGDSRA